MHLHSDCSRPRRALAIALAAAALLTTQHRALAQDPPVPPLGFPVVEHLDQPITWADGYKTLYDLRLPDPAKVTPPATGWPFVLIAHGLADGADRKLPGRQGNAWARRGYITATYDIRGQGDAIALNATGGADLSGRLERGDMVEFFHAMEARLGAGMDFDRLAVQGWSQGGYHAWDAAAMSGRLLPSPRGAHTHFPVIRCALPAAALPDWADHWLPDDAAFSIDVALGGFAPYPVLDSSFQNAAQQFWLTQDFAGAVAFVRNDPWRQNRAWLATSKVPVLVSMVQDDEYVREFASVEAFNKMPAETPRFFFLFNSEHGTPENRSNQDTYATLNQRWLDRFMKGAKDELPAQDRFLMSNVAEELPAYLDPRSVLQLRQVAAYPDTGRTQTRTLHLRQGGVLSAAAPVGQEPADRVTHQVPNGYTPLAFLQTGGDTNEILKVMPLSSVFYRSEPVADDSEVMGRACMTLHVDSQAGNLQVHVALFDEDGSGTSRYVTSGFRCVRGRTAGASTYAFELNGTSYVFRKGHRIVIAVENLSLHRPPGQRIIRRCVPYLDSYTYDCLHTASAPSRIELPILPRPGLGSRVTRSMISAFSGGIVPMEVDGAPARAGALYVTLMSGSGTVPGFSVGGQRVPINVDALTELGLQNPALAPFYGFVGMLDARGRAAPGVLAAPSALAPAVGLFLSFATVTIEKSGAFSTSSATQVRIDY